MSFSYICNVSEDIKRIVQNMVDVNFTFPKMLDINIRKDKDRLNAQQVTEIVYKINCRDCDDVYILDRQRDIWLRVLKNTKVI